jgi:hypothetical protein
MTRRRVVAMPLVLVAVAGMLAACEQSSTIHRPSTPVVLTGAQLAALQGEDPDLIVAFRHTRVDGVPTWTQLPVQVDERKVVDYGSAPASNSTPGVTGTVYGTSAIGVTSLQYADPGTWVGADGNATFDADDELVFMLEDAGTTPKPEDETEPPGVVAGSGVRVQLDDPLDPAGHGYVYLFVSAGGLVPGAGVDYVDYDFVLTGGAYKTTYKRADGPNPETSTVTTDAYRIGYSDRWYEDSWRIDAGAATGVDVLDGNKNQFGIGTCGRSNATFADAEGAFVANIDGPVRGIRSYVGANSGPLTQRTHLMYREREDVRTDLRVHAIPGVMDFIDLSAGGLGMTYRSETVPSGIAVDGVLDGVGTALTDWEAYTGPQGSVMMTSQYSTSVALPGGLDGAVDWFQRDQASPPEAQCWGDSSFYGAAGPSVVTAIPNTDPRTVPFDTWRGDRIIQFAEPPSDASLVDDVAASWSAGIADPVEASVAVYAP